MDVKWLLEKDVFHENLEPMKEEIKRQGFEYKLCDYVPFEGSIDYLSIFNEDDCVIFYGSLGFARQIRKQARWVPGVYCDLPNFECTKYYGHLGKFLLNQNYVMLPYGDLLRQKDFLFAKLGQSGTLFMRPSSGFKLFSGMMVHEESWDKDYELLSFYDDVIEKSSMIVVAEPVNLDAEWRLVTVNKKVVCGSQYKMQDWMPKISENVPDDVMAFGQEVVDAGYEPDPAWVLDVARTRDGVLRLIEINSMSCSGLYAANKEIVVRELSQLAWSEYLGLKE